MAWDPYDRDKAVWHYLRRRRECPTCHTRPEEWDPAQGGHPQAYKPVARRCPGCGLVHELESKPAVADVPGTRVFLVRNQEVIPRAQP